MMVGYGHHIMKPHQSAGKIAAWRSFGVSIFFES